MMLLLVLLFTMVGDFIEPVPTIIIFMPLVNVLTQAAISTACTWAWC